MNNYTYLLVADRPFWTPDKPDARNYIGSRTGGASKCSPEEDTDYLSSSGYVKEAILAGVKFTKIILARWATPKEMLEHEIFLHNCFEVGTNPLFYNRAKQTSSGFSTAGCVGWNKGLKRPEIAGEKNPMFGAKRPDLAEYNRVNKQGHKFKKGEDNPMYGIPSEQHPWFGRKHTEASKEKMRKPKGKKGVVLSTEHKESIAEKKRLWWAEQKAKGYTSKELGTGDLFIITAPDGSFIELFAYEFKDFGFDDTSIYRCANGKQKHTMGCTILRRSSV